MGRKRSLAICPPDLTPDQVLDELRRLERDHEQAQAKMDRIRQRRRELLGLVRQRTRTGPSCETTRSLAAEIVKDL